MNYKINTFIWSDQSNNSMSQNIGFLILRFFVGLALCTVFEKLFPKNGIWGPQEWFIQDIDKMGFPIPIFFAWLAVLSEFIGGILLMLGLFTRPAAFMNVSVTFIATFLYHKGDISGSALLSFIFMIMCICILLFGPGKYSLDYLIHGRHFKKIVNISTIVILLLSSNYVMAKAGNHSHQIKTKISADSKDSSGVIFYLQNNRLLPKKFTFIIYNPYETGNNTRVKWFFPFLKIKLQLPVDTKIYIATEPQINIVMQGNRIDQDIPFLIVNEKSKNKILKLNNQKSKSD